MRTDRETREIAALWKFMLDLAESIRVSQDELGTYTAIARADALDDLKTHIKDTAAGYGTNISS